VAVECVLIARDSANTIGAAIASVAAHVDGVLVVLNEESDEETGEVARSVGARVIRGGPFKDFASARNEALTHVRADWALQLDADDTYMFSSSFDGWPSDGEAHSIVTVCEDIAWTFVRLFRSHLRYRGRCHEYVVCEQGASFVSHVNYLRTPPSDPAATARRNAALLEGGVDARSVFHLGRAYKEMGDLDRALALFEQRVSMPGQPEEAFCAALEIARLKMRLHRSAEEVSVAYERARVMRPQRAESYVELAKLLRESGDVVGARDLARLAANLPPCTDAVFVDLAAHTWRPWAELAMAQQLLGDESAFRAAYSKMSEWRTDAPPLPLAQSAERG
jgi:tetratricopeptide (TPR) repeat protein